MPDPVELQFTRFFPATEGVRHSEIGVPHHPKNVLHSPVHEGLRNHVRIGPQVSGLLPDPDVDPVLPLLDRVGAQPVTVASGRLAGERIKVPPVPRAAQPALFLHAFLDRSFPQRSALVGTRILQGAVLAVVTCQRNRGRPRGHHRDATFLEPGRIQDLVPMHFHDPPPAHGIPVNLCILSS